MNEAKRLVTASVVVWLLGIGMGCWAGQDFQRWKHCGKSIHHRVDASGRIVCQQLIDVPEMPSGGS